MSIEKGDLVKFEYSAYIKSSGQIVDTTDEEEAKKAGIYDPKKSYGPAIITVGENQVLKGVDEMLVGMNENDEKEFDVEPEKGFGQRNEDLVRIIPLKQFRQAGINPVPGQVVNIDNTHAVIKAVNSGRVVTDFNHPLAGVTLKYKVKILKDAKTNDEKVNLVFDKYKVKCSAKVEGDKVEADYGSTEYNNDRARDLSALGLIARDIKPYGIKAISFKGEWKL